MRECAKPHTRPVFALAILIAPVMLLALTAAARADVVELTDGRRFEGTIVGEYPEGVVIDTVTGNTRVTLPFWASQVKSATRGKLPKGFFDRADRPSIVASPTSEAPRRTGTPYLEIPLRGTIGRDVTAEGVGAALRYAKQRKIRDIVFTISARGDDEGEMRAILDEMARYEGAFYYRAVVDYALGVAAALPIVTHATYLSPKVSMGSAHIGKSGLATDPPTVKYDVGATQTFLGYTFEARGWPAVLGAALEDPARPVYVWRDDKGMIRAAESKPQDVAQKRLIIAHEPSHMFILQRDDLAAIGLGKRLDYDPNADALVALVDAEGVKKWYPFSDFGAFAMQKTASKRWEQLQQEQERREAREQDKPGDAAAWEAAVKHWQRFLAVDPYKGQYASYDVYVGDGSYYFGGWREVRVSALTPAARREWQDRSLAAIDALRDMRSALLKMTDIELPRELGDSKVKVTPSELYAESARLIDRLWRERNRRAP